MNYDEARELLRDFVSESDINLFDLVSIQLDSIQKTLEIFADRNSTGSATSFALATIQTLISLLFSKKIDLEDIQELISKGEDIYYDQE